MLLDNTLKCQLYNTDLLVTSSVNNIWAKFIAYHKCHYVCIYILHACLYICSERLSSLSVHIAIFTWTTDIIKILKVFTKNLILAIFPCIMTNRFLTGVKGVYYPNLHIYKHNLAYTYSVVLMLG
jgi:hypothetical protein